MSALCAYPLDCLGLVVLSAGATVTGKHMSEEEEVAVAVNKRKSAIISHWPDGCTLPVVQHIICPLPLCLPPTVALVINPPI